MKPYTTDLEDKQLRNACKAGNRDVVASILSERSVLDTRLMGMCRKLLVGGVRYGKA